MPRLICKSAILLIIGSIFTSITITSADGNNPRYKRNEETGNDIILQDTENLNLNLLDIGKRVKGEMKIGNVSSEERDHGGYFAKTDSTINDIKPRLRPQRQAWHQEVISSTDKYGKVHLTTTVSKPVIVVITLLCILIILILMSICFLLYQKDEPPPYLVRQSEGEIEFFSQEKSKEEEQGAEQREFTAPQQPAVWKKEAAADEPSLPTEEHTPAYKAQAPSTSSLEEQLSAVLGNNSTRTDV